MKSIIKNLSPVTTQPYLFLADDVAALVQVPRGASSAAWGHAQALFCNKAHPHRPVAGYWCGCFHLREECRIGPVYWDEELCNADGMRFLLLPLVSATAVDIDMVKQHLRHARDVVQLKVANIKRWLDFQPAWDMEAAS